MAAVTAIIFVGNAHPSRGGIRPVDTIEFSEGGSPCFEFPAENDRKLRERLILIPTLENTIDDVLLFISYYLLKHSEIILAVDKVYGSAINGGRIEMYTDFTEVQRQGLYEKVMSLQDLPKVAICLFDSSHLKRTIHHLEKYSLECDVCVSVFSRRYSAWTGGLDSRGKLDGIAEM